MRVQPPQNNNSNSETTNPWSYGAVQFPSYEDMGALFVPLELENVCVLLYTEKERPVCVCVLYNEARLSCPNWWYQAKEKREATHAKVSKRPCCFLFFFLFRAAKKHNSRWIFPFSFFFFKYISTSLASNNPVRPTSVRYYTSLSFTYFF